LNGSKVRVAAKPVGLLVAAANSANQPIQGAVNVAGDGVDFRYY
jgi:hypothetical protein